MMDRIEVVWGLFDMFFSLNSCAFRLRQKKMVCHHMREKNLMCEFLNHTQCIGRKFKKHTHTMIIKFANYVCVCVGFLLTIYGLRAIYFILMIILREWYKKKTVKW